MGFGSEDVVLIKVLRQEKGYGSKRLLTVFPNRSWSSTAVNRLLRKIDAFGSTNRKRGSGRKRTVCTAANVDAVEELCMSQENAPGTHRTVLEIAREVGISKSTVHSVIRKDLQLKCFRIRRAQHLTEANKVKHLACSKQLLKRFPEHAVSFLWFTDEKLFTVVHPVNLQNDRVYARAGTKKKQVPVSRLLRTRSTFSVMVSVGVSTMGCTELIFIEPGVKINGDYYRNVLCRQHLLPAIRSISGEFFTFQQDGAPAHRARETVEMLSRETPDFNHLCNGLQTALILSRWTMQSGASCRSVSTAHESVTSTTSLSDSWRSGPDLTTRSSVLQ